jgi:phosphoglycerate kinase
MAVSEQEIVKWCGVLLAGRKAAPELTLADYLRAIPGLAAIQDLPRGTPVLVRGDLDAKPGEKIGDGDVRLRSMMDTLEFGRNCGWKQIVFGHIGRKPEGSLAKVAKRLGELLRPKFHSYAIGLTKARLRSCRPLINKLRRPRPAQC